ncbi:hypothetical protein GV819_21295 [Pseudomonas sp. Fl5BN2]|uniref:hypothetical protein n=1 Tax=unclassified Pseudomonas TaxID=196821 RepID=UPI0013781E9B|nr:MULTISPECIES: hypothetical protein [unclassified Pseudomonas]NBF04825.1 hypothetical protein [Pseudomonas sp. Fl5BN2]NBF10238.1 hypothetical protein [Pseudomonas sp. Fl4BN1]
MTLFVTLLVIVLVFIALILYSRQKMAEQNEALPAASDITAQINQTLLLSKSEPLLALKLAERLSGELRELALQLVAAELYLAGHKAKALEIGRQLPPDAREYVLNTLIESLLDTDDTQACLELLDQWGQPLPSWPLLQVRILQARGEQERALAVLGELSDPQNPAAPEEQSISNILTLSGLQFKAGMQDQALLSLERAWAQFQDPAAGRYLTEWRSLFDECAAQGRFELVLARTPALAAEEQVQAILALFEAGQTEPAFSLMADNGSLYYTTYSALMDSALKRQQLDLALRLLDVVPDLHQHGLLLHLLNHLAAQGRTAEAEALLQERVSEASQRPTLMLSLCEEQHQAQPQWTAALLAQALQLIDGYKHESEFWGGMRLHALQVQLQAQSRLPAHRRDSWLVRSSLEEMHNLREQQDAEQQLLHLCQQARLLHDLDQTAQARTLLEQAMKLLDSAPLPEIDEDVKTIYLEDIASAYLYLDEAEAAQALQDQLHAQDAGSHMLEEDLLLHHIQHQRFAQAIEALNLSTLLSDKKPLSRLYQALEEMHQRAPERAAEFQQQLLDRLISGEAMRASQHA